MKGYKKQQNKFSGFNKFEKEEYKPKPTYQKQQEKGYCIRTGVEIPFDVKRPFCYQAFQTWAQFSNENYPENFCHKTGQPSNGKTSCKQPVLNWWNN